jgi:Stage II sporulation protein E (SpoIIE)
VTAADTELGARAATMLQEVLRRTHLSPAAELAVVAAEEVRTIGADSLVIYIIDYEQRLLVPVPAPDSAGREPLSVNGTVAGRAFANTSVFEIEPRGSRGRRLWLPLVDGTERLGSMEVTFTDRQEPLDEGMVTVCERYAHLLTGMIFSKSAYSDFFELLRRHQPMTVASELIWKLVPPLVLAADGLVLAAMLEPSYDIGGDAFDYAINEGVLHFAVFDAMGHGLAASGVAAYTLSAYRNGRRLHQTPAETYLSIDAALHEQYAGTRFTTALVAELELASGRLQWFSAGHPAPLLLRDGRFIKELELKPSPPMGMHLSDDPPAIGEESLQPGDMILLYTDGLTEARRPGGELFTVERLGEFIEREAASGQAAPETLRGLREAIIERREASLLDDATAVLVEWRRGTENIITPDTV